MLINKIITPIALVIPTLNQEMFGQVVVGPPGAGKTSYCRAMKEFLAQLGRKALIVNLDPANEHCECDVDVRDLVCLDDVMDRLQVGPNGAMLFCMEFLENNLDWLQSALKAHEGHYFLFDFPGQVELFTSHNSVRNIVAAMQKFPMQLCAVNLVDSHYCSDGMKFISVLLMSLSCMIKLELPHVNVLSKIDLLEAMGPVPFGLDFYTEVLDLNYLVSMLEETLPERYAALSAALCGLVEDYGLVKVRTDRYPHA